MQELITLLWSIDAIRGEIRASDVWLADELVALRREIRALIRELTPQPLHREQREHAGERHAGGDVARAVRRLAPRAAHRLRADRFEEISFRR